jgi:hypothetical protein
MLYMCQGKNVPERRSGLRPSEKELPKLRSGTVRHKNTPGNNDDENGNNSLVSRYSYWATGCTTAVCFHRDRFFLPIITRLSAYAVICTVLVYIYCLLCQVWHR